MKQEHQYMVVQAICDRFRNAGHVNAELLKADATALIQAVALVDPKTGFESVTTGVDVALDSNKGLIDSLQIPVDIVLRALNNCEGASPSGCAKPGLTLDELHQIISGGCTVILFGVSGHN